MALSLSFCYKNASDCKSILFKESTGEYNATTNLTGWGTDGSGEPNTDISTITAAVLIITKPDDTQVTIDVSSKFPTINTELVWQITAGDLGYESSIEDGLYTLTYKLTTDTNTYIHVSKTFLFSCTLDCKIKKILADSVKYQMNCDDCNQEINDNLMNALMINTLYKGLCAMSGCGTATLKINNALENLQTLVAEYDIENCNCN
jgi:hypothetical protein